MSTPNAPIKSVALVAHDHRKDDLIEWSQKHAKRIAPLALYATGTTGKLLTEALQRPVTKLLSGPLGGDQQIGAKIAEGEIDVLIFFWDPLAPMPHDPDIKALLRLATLWNIPIACNEATADMLISSPLLTDQQWQRTVPDFSHYQKRNIGPLSQKISKSQKPTDPQ